MFLMAKLSFMKFYPADWFNDTMILSAQARGCWINLICLMWNAAERGRWIGTYEEFARVTGIPWEQAPAIITELQKVADVTFQDAQVTLENRRQLREQKAHEYKANRQKRYLERREKDAKETPKTLDVRRQTPQDVRQSQQQHPCDLAQTDGPESPPLPPPPSAFKPEDVMRLWNRIAHPALARVKMLPKTREAHIKARMQDFRTEAEWTAIIERVNQSSFLTGQKTKWRVHFDWILNPNNITKIMEGNYDDTASHQS